MKVVVGKAYGHDTPIFMSNMRSVIFRPYWNVPPSIARAEIIPSLERNPAYLTKENMEIVDNHDNVVSSEAVTDEMLQEARDRKAFVPAAAGSQKFAGADQIHVSERIRRLYARHSGHGIVLEIKARLQPRLHPAGKARRPGSMGPPRQSGLGHRSHSRRDERNEDGGSDACSPDFRAHRIWNGDCFRRWRWCIFTTTSTSTMRRSNKRWTRAILTRASRRRFGYARHTRNTTGERAPYPRG